MRRRGGSLTESIGPEGFHDPELPFVLESFLSELSDRMVDQSLTFSHRRPGGRSGPDFHRSRHFPGLHPWNRVDDVGDRIAFPESDRLVSIRSLSLNDGGGFLGIGRFSDCPCRSNRKGKSRGHYRLGLSHLCKPLHPHRLPQSPWFGRNSSTSLLQHYRSDGGGYMDFWQSHPVDRRPSHVSS